MCRRQKVSSQRQPLTRIQIKQQNWNSWAKLNFMRYLVTLIQRGKWISLYNYNDPVHELIATFRLQYEDDYEYEFSVLSTCFRFGGRNFLNCACSELKTCTRSRPRTPIWRSLLLAEGNSVIQTTVGFYLLHRKRSVLTTPISPLKSNWKVTLTAWDTVDTGRTIRSWELKSTCLSLYSGSCVMLTFFPPPTDDSIPSNIKIVRTN